MMSPGPPVTASRRAEDFRRLAYWLAAPFFCLILFFYGVRAWYQQDDFVWLAQRLQIHSLHDFLWAIFHPSVHGTFRPLSERLFFLVCGTLFGADALPARLCVFLTQVANLVLLSLIAVRVTGSRLAGLLAPILWTANGALAFPMAWTSAYMEILCAFCILSAFYCFLRHIDSGRRSWYYGQWAIFLVGFGVMESMIVYPAIAAAYALSCARKYVRSTLPLFGGSVLFFGFHTIFVPKQSAGAYSMHFDLTMARTFAIYWKWALVPPNWVAWRPSMASWAPLLVTMLTAAALLYAVISAWRRDLLPLFSLSWFAILIAPMLPLSEHISHYYLTLPTIGIGLLGAVAAAHAARDGWPQKISVATVLLVYLLVQAPYTAQGCKWWYERSQRIEKVVLGVAAERQIFPGKTFVLTGVDEALLYGAFWDGAFRAFGIPDTYVDPADRNKIPPDAQLGDTSRFFLDPADLQQSLRGGTVRVLSAAGPVLVDVTSQFQDAAQRSPLVAPRLVDVGSVRSQSSLRGTWYELEDDHRWMGRSAGVVIGGPQSPEQQLHLSGFCPAAQVASAPLRGKVTADGQVVGELSLARGDTSFEVALPLPAALSGKALMEVQVQLDRTFRAPGDVRDLGLSFGAFEIR